MKKLNKIGQNFFAKHKDLFLGLFVVCWIAALSVIWNTEWFRASIIKIPEKFNGTTRPIDKVPNWFSWWLDNKSAIYSQISEDKLVDMPSYNNSVWWKKPSEIREESKEKLAKLTYAVVYLWNYNVDSRSEYSGSHPAVDIRVPVWTPVRSVANGKVVKVINSNIWFWNHIVIEMQNVPDYPNNEKRINLYASYSHLSETIVSVWDIVKKWQVIWKSWNSGTSTTPHLHFQIDRKEAKWFPYWPFDSNELYAASMSFFSAIQKWFKQENAIENTINPMRWVESHLDWNTEWWDEASSEDSVFKNFKIISADDFTTDWRLSLTVIAEDSDWKVITDFKSSTDIEVSSSSNNARFSKNLRFKSWIATVFITDRKEEEFDFIIKYRSKSFSKKIKVLKWKNSDEWTSEDKKEEIKNEEPVKTEENTVSDSAKKWSSESVVVRKETQAFLESDQKMEEPKKEELNKEEPKVVSKPKQKEIIPKEAYEVDKNVNVLFTWENKVFVGDKLNIDIFLNDKDWAFADIKRDYAIDLSWVWELNQNLLRKSDFVWSKIRVQFISQKAWDAILSLNGTDFEIKVSEKPVEEIKKEVLVVSEEKVASSLSETTKDPEKTSSSVVSSDTSTKDNTSETTKDENIFTDVWMDHRSYQAIKYLKEAWVIWWYDDGSFKPNKVVSRVEAVKMIFKALKIEATNNVTLPFSDTDDSAWYSGFVWAALKKAIVKWYSDWSFKPTKWVNRAEYYKILLLSAWVEIQDADGDPYDDCPANSWFWDYLAYVKINKLSDASWNFYPETWVSRAEVAESIYRLVKILGI